MLPRSFAVAACMVAILPGLAAAAAPGGQTGASGTSSREARRQAIESLPLDRMPEATRAVVDRQLRATAVYRRLPVETVACDAELLDFVLARPETLVELWRVLGISRLSLDPTAARQWRLADGWGTVGTVRLLHHERRARGGLFVFHGRGGYSGPLSARDLTGSCLVVVRHWPLAGADDPPRQAVQVDAFLDVDGVGLEIVTRALQPLIVQSADANLHEISLFVSQFSAAAARSPAGVARLTNRMTRTAAEDRRTLAALAAGKPAAADGPDDSADLQAELAARWLPADAPEEATPR